MESWLHDGLQVLRATLLLYSGTSCTSSSPMPAHHGVTHQPNEPEANSSLSLTPNKGRLTGVDIERSRGQGRRVQVLSVDSRPVERQVPHVH
jgi:hypothetical protein